nr:hypothetical protein [uncultured Mediterraneibacter sp.]
MNYNKKEENILKKLCKIKEYERPNFFITGKSICAMETLSLRMVENLENQGMMKFKGIYKYFTIIMPYFNSKDGAHHFIHHLMDSMSVARDCYDTFSGFVLIELSEQWSSEGYNDTLDIVLDYIHTQKSVCYVILCLKGKENIKTNKLFAEFTRYDTYIYIEAQTPSINQCVMEFKLLATEAGLELMEEAEDLLVQKFKERDEKRIENMEVVSKLIKQITLEKMIENVKNKNIELEDIQKYFPESKKKICNSIGFIRDFD